jgi:SagB-type dehydrogenase family enzyme
VTAELPDLPAGVYHFGPHDFALRRLRAGDFRAALVQASGESPEIARAPVVVASASTFWRNAWKYRERAWRHCFWDAGTLHANLLAVAGGEELAPYVVLGYADRAVEHLLGLDPAREGSLALVALGHARRPPPAAPAAPELHLATRPLSGEEVGYPAIRAAHAASSLGAAEAAAWRGALAPHPEPAARGPLVALRPLAEPSRPREPLERVIRRRGSTRAFDAQRGISFEELSTLLEAATRPIPVDFRLGPASAPLADLYLIVHAVDGLAAGTYYLRRGEAALERLREGSFRGEAGYLGLGQELPADAAANVYCLADLPRVLARFGNRGYRAAQLEGGITGGRLYLAAYALGFGATGLTFFDDPVTEFFSPHAAGKAVLFLTAVGHPDRSRLGLA